MGPHSTGGRDTASGVGLSAPHNPNCRKKDVKLCHGLVASQIIATYQSNCTCRRANISRSASAPSSRQSSRQRAMCSNACSPSLSASAAAQLRLQPPTPPTLCRLLSPLRQARPAPAPWPEQLPSADCRPVAESRSPWRWGCEARPGLQSPRPAPVQGEQRSRSSHHTAGRRDRTEPRGQRRRHPHTRGGPKHTLVRPPHTQAGDQHTRGAPHRSRGAPHRSRGVPHCTRESRPCAPAQRSAGTPPPAPHASRPTRLSRPDPLRPTDPSPPVLLNSPSASLRRRKPGRRDRYRGGQCRGGERRGCCEYRGCYGCLGDFACRRVLKA